MSEQTSIVESATEETRTGFWARVVDWIRRQIFQMYESLSSDLRPRHVEIRQRLKMAEVDQVRILHSSAGQIQGLKFLHFFEIY